MMTPQQESETRAAVQGLICDILKRKRVDKKPEDIAPGLSLTRELGIDSLDLLQLLAIAEKRFKLRIPESELKSMDDLAGIMAALKRHWPA